MTHSNEKWMPSGLTVGELIEQLKTLPEDYTVVYYGQNTDMALEGVELLEVWHEDRQIYLE